MTDKEKKELKLEIKGRKLLIKKLESARKSIDKKVVKINADRGKRKESLSEYKSEEELNDAYGWECITEEEYNSLLNAMRNGAEAIDKEVSPEEIALHILKDFIGRMVSDVGSFKFDLLPVKEQNKVLQKNEEIRKKREERGNK